MNKSIKHRVVATCEPYNYPVYWDFNSAKEAETFVIPKHVKARNVEIIHGTDYELELDDFVRRQNVIKHPNFVQTPELFWFERLKAKFNCFLHGHVWEYNGIHPSCSLLLNGDVDMWVCTQCGKIHMSYTPPKGYKSNF